MRTTIPLDLKENAFAYFEEIGLPEETWERLLSQLAKLEKSTNPVMVDHTYFNDVEFCYNKEISGSDDQSKFDQFVQTYMIEKDIQDIELAKNMVSDIIRGVVEKKAAPVSVANIMHEKKIHKVLVFKGSRHRVAAAKVSNSKIPTKILTARV